ncbi:MAG TPA: hypothetical protein VK395_01020 [Gemmataceae bacterium]|nr:hypothetical protein [Gemmataceae bacterium]
MLLSDSGTTDPGPLAHDSQNDPDLARVLAAWPILPEHIKAAILALVETGRRGR